MKFRLTQQCDYVQGHLRYGHKEGIIEADSLEEAKMKVDNEEYDMDLVIDDYEVDDYDTGCNHVEIEEVEE